MPCSDGGPSQSEIDAPKVAASLCAVMYSLERSKGLLTAVLNGADWAEAGVSKEWLVGWWTEHKIEDRARRLREAEQDALKKIRENAWAKLTEEEKAAFGGRYFN